MLLGRKNKNEDSPSINVKIDEQVIKSSPDLKLLGVTLDAKGKKASKKVGVLVRLRNMIPREAKLQLYKLAIVPNFNILSHSVAFLQSIRCKNIRKSTKTGITCCI